MVTRTETAAATRSALVRAASDLLAEGGPDAVTLRGVGARAGLSRGAPYGHFTDKEHLLSQLAVDAWTWLAHRVKELRGDPELAPNRRLTAALLALIEVGRNQPHLYALMFATPADNPEAAAAAGFLQSQFLAIVGDVVGEADALRYGALLMSSAHGIAGLELSGHLAVEKWGASPEDLVNLLVTALRPGPKNTGGKNAQ